MSTSSTSPQWRIIERILCNTCFEILGRGQHQAKLLDCYHNICKACVEKRIVDGKIKCPFCTKITLCPSGSSDEIFTNNDRMGLVDRLFKVCNTNVPLSFCETCREGAVEVCRVKSHRIYPISEDFRKYLSKIELLRRAYRKETRADSCMFDALD